MEEAGIANVGSSTSQVKQIKVTFPEPFSAAPIVVANALQTDPKYPPGSIKDTFAVTITSVSTSGFTANVCRVDSEATSWGQNLSLGYTAATP